jgi:hypothetical protein
MFKARSSAPIANLATMLDEEENDHSLWMFVEGNDDHSCFAKFIYKKGVRILPAGERLKAIEALKVYLKRKHTKKKKAISIIDADYDRILSIKYTLKELFFTDNHDLLVQTINSEALHCIIRAAGFQDYSENKVKELRKNLFQECKIVGYLRLINTREGLGINLKNIKNFHKLNDKEIVKQVIIQTEDCQISESSLTEKLQREKENNLELSDLCQGHDLCALLSITLKKKLNANNIAKHLMLSYDSNCFKKSNLYKNIKKWGKKNSLKIFRI